MLDLPYEPQIGEYAINIHLVLEYLAFFVAYRYYVYVKRQQEDHITHGNRLTIIIGAGIGALIGSRVMGFLENPIWPSKLEGWLQLANTKTIMGGLFGGLIGVELIKKWIGEKASSGDLFTLPIIVGIFIGRIGCFLSGTNEFTYGKASTFMLAMDLGDGVMRHPVALYELMFLLVLFVVLRAIGKQQKRDNGDVFKYFMLAYFGFRFCIEYLKPNVFFVGGLSSIQWLCVVCYLYYYKTILKLIRYAK